MFCISFIQNVSGSIFHRYVLRNTLKAKSADNM